MDKAARSFLLFLAFYCMNGALTAQENELARTPPMGWNSLHLFGCKVSDAIIRAQADALVSSGMKAAGYTYVNIDDCWQGTRDEKGFIHPNERFPDMKALAGYVHSKGLRFGISSSLGPTTCAGYEGSFAHEEQDAQTYAGWGVDYLKYDYCSFKGDLDAQRAAYKKMHDVLLETGRPIVYSLSQYGMDRVWRWGASVGGNLWRTSADIADDPRRPERMVLNGFGENGLERFAGPGHWNDPDVLVVGNGKMTAQQERTQMSLWCVLAAPLLASNDLTKMNPETLAILTNPEVIAVDQDPAAIQGHRVWQEGPIEVWMKPLADGSKAVGLFNHTEGAANRHPDQAVTVHLRHLGVGETAAVRDLWTRKDLGVFEGSFTVTLPPEGVVLIRVK